MTKKYTTLLLLCSLTIVLNAQSVNKNFDVDWSAEQSNGKIQVQRFIEKHSGLQGQQFGIVISNLTQHKLKITGIYSAILTCGNQTQADIDIILKPGETQGGHQYGMDATGLTATVFSESCKGNPAYENGKQIGYNRIKRVTYDITKITNLTEQEEQPATKTSNQQEENSSNTNNSTASNSSKGATNAGYYKTDNANTQTTYNNKNSNSLYNGTIISNNANSNKTTTNTYAQQFQQWQNNNAQTQQSINSTITAVGNQLQQQLQSNYEEKQRQMDEEHNKTMAKIQQHEDEMNERLEKEKEANRQTEIDMQILEYNDKSKILPTYIYATSMPDILKQTFYITYQRYYTSNTIVISTYTLNKYADGTWMSESDIKRKVNLTTTLKSSYMYAGLIGQYRSKADVLIAIKQIKINASTITSNISVDESFTSINSPAKNINNNFWDN